MELEPFQHKPFYRFFIEQNVAEQVEF